MRVPFVPHLHLLLIQVFFFLVGYSSGYLIFRICLIQRNRLPRTSLGGSPAVNRQVKEDFIRGPEGDERSPKVDPFLLESKNSLTKMRTALNAGLVG